MDQEALRKFLDRKVKEYNQPAFIADDPICVPHSFRKQEDIEISAFFAAIFAWGNRTTIIKKSRELMRLMDDAPHQFVVQHTEKDLKRLTGFKHRTFNATDLYYFIDFLGQHYGKYGSLEDAFLIRSEGAEEPEKGRSIEGRGLAGFYRYFFSLDEVPGRTRKHIASPDRNSSCKRLNMFLRWMVRCDAGGVDFGLWRRLSPAALVCPLDVHVARVARHFGLLTRRQTDWTAAMELTDRLRAMDPEDPVKYDFALFGLGVVEKF